MWVNRVILAPCLQLPVRAQERTWYRYPGWFGALSMDAHRGARDIEKLPPVGAAPSRRQSHILGFGLVIGSGIIAPRRNNIAHLRRPWRATSIWINWIFLRLPGGCFHAFARGSNTEAASVGLTIHRVLICCIARGKRTGRRTVRRRATSAWPPKPTSAASPECFQRAVRIEHLNGSAGLRVDLVERVMGALHRRNLHPCQRCLI
jgi:hypothetical protein